jgi:hypothetical protein
VAVVLGLVYRDSIYDGFIERPARAGGGSELGLPCVPGRKFLDDRELLHGGMSPPARRPKFLQQQHRFPHRPAAGAMS